MPDQDAVARFVERFAGGLADAGMPRMPARVFVALLATDSGRLTADWHFPGPIRAHARVWEF